MLQSSPGLSTVTDNVPSPSVVEPVLYVITRNGSWTRIQISRNIESATCRARLREAAHLYVHQAAKSTFHADRRNGTLPIA